MIHQFIIYNINVLLILKKIISFPKILPKKIISLQLVAGFCMRKQSRMFCLCQICLHFLAVSIPFLLRSTSLIGYRRIILKIFCWYLNNLLGFRSARETSKEFQSGRILRHYINNKNWINFYKEINPNEFFIVLIELFWKCM